MLCDFLQAAKVSIVCWMVGSRQVSLHRFMDLLVVEKRNSHTLCVMLPPNYNAIYIDTEGGFRPERIQEIANARGLISKQILQRNLVTKALDIEQLESRIEAACSRIDSDNKIKLLIVDSIIYHYRAECVGRSKLPEKIQRLNKYMHLLLQTASSNSVGVVVTNHQRSHQ